MMMKFHEGCGDYYFVDRYRSEHKSVKQVLVNLIFSQYDINNNKVELILKLILHVQENNNKLMMMIIYIKLKLIFIERINIDNINIEIKLK